MIHKNLLDLMECLFRAYMLQKPSNAVCWTFFATVPYSPNQDHHLIYDVTIVGISSINSSGNALRLSEQHFKDQGRIIPPRLTKVIY